MLSLPVAGHIAQPGRNLILRHLLPSDGALIAPHLRDVAVQDGQTILRPGDPISVIYFPETSIVALEEGVGRRHRIEVALAGYEGLIGWPALLGCTRSVHRAVVQVQDGTARCIDVAPLIAACQASRTLWTALLAFVQEVTFQMARAIVAHLESSLDQRIARWLLMRHDRIRGDQIAVRHDQIADGLNARRASITNRLHILEGERLIRNKRGRIDVHDRVGLEAFAGDAYGLCEANYSRTIAPFGKSSSAAPGISDHSIPAEPYRSTIAGLAGKVTTKRSA